MTQQSYTFGSDEGHQAILDALPRHCEMQLNKPDMTFILHAVLKVWEDDPTDDYAASFYGSVASTLGVELI